MRISPVYKTDFTAFRGILEQCATVFNKPKPDDMTVQAYWNALKDLPIGLVAARAESHSRYGKFFPKPVELRPKDDKPRTDATHDGAFQEGVKRADERLEYLRRTDPGAWSFQISPKVYELGRARGMLDGEIEQKILAYMARP